MIAFIVEHHDDYGVEPICRVLPPLGFMVPQIINYPSCPHPHTGNAKHNAVILRDSRSVRSATLRLNQRFYAPAPNMLWVSDYTYVATWAGFVYVAFVIDAYASRIVSWRISRAAHTSFVLDALEQAIHERRPAYRGGLFHHSDRGSLYVSIRYTERLAEAGIEPSVGSVSHSYDNALAETINDLYEAEVIRRREPCRSFEAVEFATLEWVQWFNNRRLLEPIGNIPPAEAQVKYYAMLDEQLMIA